MSYVHEPFEKLDVMDNFLFNQLSTNPKTKEGFLRCLIRNLLGKEAGRIIIRAENMIYPTLPDKRGVRLDVQIDELNQKDDITTIYDIEPHRDFERDYPKKIRFSQAQIDKNNMSSGNNDFSCLPELFIVNITNYDPFGDDQMVYTFQKRCIEAPEVVYNDGVTILYFNTTGTKGGSEELKNFLEYLEKSEPEKAVTSATQELQGYVEQIKHDAEIGGNYMTFGDLLDKITAEVAEEAAEKAAAEAAEKAAAEAAKVAAEKDAIIAEKDTTIAEKDSVIEELRAKLAALENK